MRCKHPPLVINRQLSGTDGSLSPGAAAGLVTPHHPGAPTDNLAHKGYTPDQMEFETKQSGSDKAYDFSQYQVAPRGSAPKSARCIWTGMTQGRARETMPRSAGAV